MRACVEAALCQAIPLAIDLITRLIGINVGKRVKDIVARISKKIRGVIDKLINKLSRTKLGKKFTQVTGKKISTFKEREQSKEAKEAREKEQAEDTRRVREREASQSDNKIAAAAASMGNWGTRLSDNVSDRKKAQSNKVFNVTGLTGALKGEKEGDLGVSLDNSAYVKQSAKNIDNYFKNRKAEKALARLRLALNSSVLIDKAIEEIEPNRRHHILNGSKKNDHKWYLITDHSSWEEIKPIIKTVLQEGTPEHEGTTQDVYKVTKSIRENVTLVMLFYTDSSGIRISDAYVQTTENTE